VDQRATLRTDGGGRALFRAPPAWGNNSKSRGGALLAGAGRHCGRPSRERSGTHAVPIRDFGEDVGERKRLKIFRVINERFLVIAQGLSEAARGQGCSRLQGCAANVTSGASSAKERGEQAAGKGSATSANCSFTDRGAAIHVNQTQGGRRNRRKEGGNGGRWGSEFDDALARVRADRVGAPSSSAGDGGTGTRECRLARIWPPSRLSSARRPLLEGLGFSCLRGEK